MKFTFCQCHKDREWTDSFIFFFMQKGVCQVYAFCVEYFFHTFCLFKWVYVMSLWGLIVCCHFGFKAISSPLFELRVQHLIKHRFSIALTVGGYNSETSKIWDTPFCVVDYKILF